MTAGRILELAAQACRRSRTLVGVVDECQNLSAGRGRAMTGFLKSAFNELPVTLMFVGQGLDTTPLFKASSDKDEQQQAAAQLIERKIALEYGRLMEDDTGVKELVEIVRCVNRQLPLQEQPTLVGDDLEWLLRASAGNRGRTLSVLRMAALEAVGDEERFCRSSFERGAARIGISA